MNKNKTILKKGKASLIGVYQNSKLISAYIYSNRKIIKFPQLTVNHKTKSGKINSLDGGFMQKFTMGNLIEQFDQYHWGASEKKRKMKFDDWIQYAIDTIARYMNFYA